MEAVILGKRQDRGPVEARRTKRGRPLSVPAIISTAVVCALAMKVFMIDLFLVRGSSMEPLLRSGSVVPVLRCAYGLRWFPAGRYCVSWGGPAVGDVVLVSKPGMSERVIKRVFETGPAFIAENGGFLEASGGRVPVPEGMRGHLAGGVYVPAGQVYLVGDNPAASFDSRMYGPVPVDTVLGKALCVETGW